MKHKFTNSILGGTFDHLHKGHEVFLTEAFQHSEKVTIGIAATSLFQEKAFSNTIQNYEERKKTVEEFLEIKGYLSRAEIIPLSDIYGNSLKEENIDAIFVTKQTLPNAQLINEKRNKLGFRPLEIVVVPLQFGKSGNVISSTDIRSGETDRKGVYYKDSFQNKVNLFLPHVLREELGKQFGPVIEDDKISPVIQGKFAIAVGDIVVSTLLKNGFTPNFCVYDLMTRRQKITDKEILSHLPKADIKINNSQGVIEGDTSTRLYELVKEAAFENKNFSIEVEGEEDLLALPLILFAPLESVVIYGLRRVGMVGINVTEEMKIKISNYISKFEKVSS